ncbi:hypothetical protein EXE10_17265 [Acinetobacter sp. WCHAc060033]|nr:hypothetical protein EXE10_17265 [Acinetobacter sp. WCHAc060033]
MVEMLIALIAVLIGIIIIVIKKLIEVRKNPPCQHLWRTDRITDIYDTTFGDRSFDRTEVRCQCNKCGVWKKFKV